MSWIDETVGASLLSDGEIVVSVTGRSYDQLIPRNVAVTKVDCGASEEAIVKPSVPLDAITPKPCMG